MRPGRFDRRPGGGGEDGSEKALPAESRQKVVAVNIASYLLAFFFIFPTIMFLHYLVEREMIGSAKVLARHSPT